LGTCINGICTGTNGGDACLWPTCN
jgi:hypothetical protein